MPWFGRSSLYLVGFVAFLGALTQTLGLVGAEPQHGMRVAIRSEDVPEATEMAPALGPIDLPGDPPTPVVSLRVHVPALGAANQPLRYRLCITNDSPGAAHHVTIRNPIPAHARFVSATPEAIREGEDLVWRLGTLPGCACREIILILEPLGTGDVKNCARVQFEHGQCVVTRIGRPSLGLRILAPTQASLNQTLTYRVLVSNPGPTELRDVTVSDILDPGLVYAAEPPTDLEKKVLLSWRPFRLAPGETRGIEYALVARREGKLCNSVSASASSGARQEARHCVQVLRTGLQVDITGPEEALVGEATSYTVTIANVGTAPLGNVLATLALPPGVQAVDPGPGGEVGEGVVRWPLGILEGGRKKTVSVRLLANAPAIVTLRATASTAGSVRDSFQYPVTFRGGAGLTFEVEVDRNPVDVNTKVVITVRVINQGNDTARGVQLTMTLPPPFQDIAWGPEGVGARSREGGVVEFDKVDEIPPRERKIYTLRATAAKEGRVLITGALTAETPALPRPVRKDTLVTIVNPG